MTSYFDCGVSIDGNDALISIIKGICSSTHNDSVIEGVGGFCSLYAVPNTDLIITASSDGVGSKLQLADELSEYGYLSTVGFDLVGMVINDLLPCGSKPLFFLDYLAVRSIGKTDDKIQQILEGVAAACKIAGVALVGGETAELPHLFNKRCDFDIAGFGVGIVSKENVKGKHLVKPGDIVVGIESNGPHSNGYSLITKVLKNFVLNDAGVRQEVMKPTFIYSRVIESIKSPKVHAMAHITGGGLISNTMRSIPDHLEVQWEKLDLPTLFWFISYIGDVEEEEMRKVFNCGIGFVVIVDRSYSSEAISIINSQGFKSRTIGTVVLK